MYDTLLYVKRLEEVGFPRDQAEAQVRIMTEFVDSNLATKNDLLLLRAELKQDINEVRHDMLRLEDRLTIKLGGLMIVGITALATLIKFF